MKILVFLFDNRPSRQSPYIQENVCLHTGQEGCGFSPHHGVGEMGEHFDGGEIHQISEV